MKKRIITLFIAVFIAIVFPVSAYADTGPKPSVKINVEGINEDFYITLLSQVRSTGPYSYISSQDVRTADKSDPKYIFANYKDADGFFFIGNADNLESGEDEYQWGYYPPQVFKVIIYIPSTQTFYESDICERYAFDSYFNVRINDEVSGLDAVTSYNYTSEIILFIARLIVTLLIELLIAKAFGLFTKKLVPFIIGTNIVTQVLLNIILFRYVYTQGYLLYKITYIMLEILVIAIEAIAYSVFFRKKQNVKTSHSIFYAVCANVASCILGFVLAYIIPSLF